MLIPGHLATAVLAGVGVARLGGRRASVRWMLLPAALGALTPDLLDKSRMALGGSIYGRTIGHSTLFLLGITLVWAVWTGVRRRRRASAGADPKARGRGASASSGSSRGASRGAPQGASPRPALSTAFGFWVLGVATHSVADLADDALGGLMRGGMVTSSWFAWPWATPYTHVFRVREPVLTAESLGGLGAWLQGWSAPVSPLEAAVLAAAGVWVVVRVAGRARASGPKS